MIHRFNEIGLRALDPTQVTGDADTADGADHAFLWTASGGMQDRGTLPGGTQSSAAAINNPGQITGNAVTADGAGHAVLWTPATPGN